MELSLGHLPWLVVAWVVLVVLAVMAEPAGRRREVLVTLLLVGAVALLTAVLWP